MSRSGRLSGALLLAASLLGSVWLADRVLALIGYPAAPVQSYTYPAHSKETLQMVDHTFEYRSNDMGIRYYDIPLEKAPGEKRVVMIGDSFIEGEGVDLEQTVGVALENRYREAPAPVRFINCGISGTGPEEYLQVLVRVGLRYSPDHVLMMIYANDLSEIARTVPASTLIGDERPQTRWKRWIYDLFPKLYLLGRRTYALHFSRFEPDVLRLTREEARSRGIPEEAIARWERAVPSEVLKLADDGWIDGNWLSAGLIYPDYWIENFDLTIGENKKKWPLMELMLDRIHSVCRERSIPLSVVYAPHPYQYDAGYSPVFENAGLRVRKEWLREETAYQKLVRGWAGSRQLPYLDLTPFFQRKALEGGPPLNFRLDQHWTPAGHAFAAEVIYDWLTREKMLSIDTNGPSPNTR